MKKARDIMTREVRTVSPSMPIDELAQAFSREGVSGFPVVDEAGALVGVVTESDLIHQNQRLHIPTMVTILDAVIVLGSSKKLEQELRRLAAVRVEEIMTADPLTVDEEAGAQQVATLMAEHDIHTVPVLDGEGRLCGVIGKIDVVRAMAAP